MRLKIGKIDSEVGVLTIATNERGEVCAIELGSRGGQLPQRLRTLYGSSEVVGEGIPEAVNNALVSYFAGDLSAIDAVDLAKPGSELERRVWAALREIPHGTTTTYGELARKLGYNDPRAAVDVGAANAANPIAIVVPCHRVIAKNGDLRGYAWGLSRKAWLLAHEGATPMAAKARTVETGRLPGF
jgi:methylated-DNA-[protein]-cysteine S-methyltransferase